jgi:NAD dependent epimerase/dehydratase family enzyme
VGTALVRALQGDGHKVVVLTRRAAGDGLQMSTAIIYAHLGGPVAGGGQYMSWIHEDDFTAAVRFIIGHDALAGPVNLASPGPVQQRDFMRELRAAWGVPAGLPATRWMAEVGALVIRTDTELLLKSRRVIPGRLTAAGFGFRHGTWPEAARDLARRARARAAPGSRRS